MNCQGKGGSLLGIQTVMSVADEVDPDWDVLFLSEADFLCTCIFDLDIFPHFTERRWPGPGSRAMRFIVHERVASLRRRMTWRGRAGLLEFVCAQAVGRKCGSLSILGVHGPHCDDDVPDFFNELSTLFASREQKRVASSQSEIGTLTSCLLVKTIPSPTTTKGSSITYSED